MRSPRIGTTSTRFLWVLLTFFGVSATASGQSPGVIEGAAPSEAFAFPSGGSGVDATPQFAAVTDPTWVEPQPPIDATTADDDPVQSVTYLNEATEMGAYESPQGLGFLCLDELCEEIKRRDAAASSSSSYGRGMTVVLDDKGKKYIRFLTWAQVWTTFTDNNPGTVNAYGRTERQLAGHRPQACSVSHLFAAHGEVPDPAPRGDQQPDVHQRRRLGNGAGIGPNGAGKKPQIFVHDIWNEYAVIPQSECGDFSLAVGAGLHYWNGISRKSSSSTMSYMTVDSPIFCWPNIEFSDQFARQFGWYAKGKLHKLDYRVSVNQPFNADDRRRA